MVGRTSSFQVYINNEYLAFSKLDTGAFPDYDALAQAVLAYSKSGAAPAGWKKENPMK